MSAGSRGLGRGLDALFGSTADAAPMAAVAPAGTAQGGTDPLKVKLSALAPNPQQPRRYFSEQQMEELTASVKAQGILQPILVRPLTKSRDGTQNTYEIVAGERRWRAAQKAGLATVPVVVREMNDQEVLIVALMENLQREDLTPMEEALGLQQLKDEFGLSQEDLAARLGKSRSAIANTLRLLALPEAARADLMEGRISAGHARALLVVTDPQSQELFRHYMTAKHCTVREAESIAALWKETGALPADITADVKQPAARHAAKPEPDAALAALQEKLAQALALPVSIKGRETKGTISLKYGSREELDTLLEKLGLGE
ncbi:Chromosome-partitioning protein ParB [uncultured delta proteobacterium]|uniref:Chromosome-partitioning protein ParB n=1 Tax=uncultured delta proteobacterium TaxID=34034 RepID=A0A212JZ29_9DELT|nr:Chromosome-partitioning protein ParB [uncultured delta proteobacterium]